MQIEYIDSQLFKNITTKEVNHIKVTQSFRAKYLFKTEETYKTLPLLPTPICINTCSQKFT